MTSQMADLLLGTSQKLVYYHKSLFISEFYLTLERSGYVTQLMSHIDMEKIMQAHPEKIRNFRLQPTSTIIKRFNGLLKVPHSKGRHSNGKTNSFERIHLKTEKDDDLKELQNIFKLKAGETVVW